MLSYTPICFLVMVVLLGYFGHSFPTTIMKARSARMKPTVYIMPPSLFDIPPSLQSLINTMVTVETKPEGYVYGAVESPPFVLPLAAALAILTAAIPFLLRPGEKALEQQRIDEETTNSQFNKRKDKNLR